MGVDGDMVVFCGKISGCGKICGEIETLSDWNTNWQQQQKTDCSGGEFQNPYFYMGLVGGQGGAIFYHSAS